MGRKSQNWHIGLRRKALASEENGQPLSLQWFVKVAARSSKIKDARDQGKKCLWTTICEFFHNLVMAQALKPLPQPGMGSCRRRPTASPQQIQMLP